MGLRDRISRARRGNEPEVHVGDPRFDDWEVIRDFEDVKAATAWRRHLDEAGVEAILTADWPLDRFGRSATTNATPSTAAMT